MGIWDPESNPTPPPSSGPNPIDRMKQFFKGMSVGELERVKKMIQEELYDRERGKA